MRIRKTLLVAGLVSAVAAPSFAYADCHSRRVTGAVVGGLTGGAIGAAAATAPWGFAAAGMGALLGHTIAASTCRHAYYRHAYYYRSRHHYAYAHRHYYHRDYYGGYQRPGYYNGYYHREYYGGY